MSHSDHNHNYMLPSQRQEIGELRFEAGLHRLRPGDHQWWWFTAIDFENINRCDTNLDQKHPSRFVRHVWVASCSYRRKESLLEEQPIVEMYCFLLSTRWDHGVSSQEWYHGQEDRKRRGRRQPSPSLASLPSLATQSVESGKKISRKVLRSHCTNSNICFKQSVTSHRSQYFSNGSRSHSTFKYWTNCCIVLPFRWKKNENWKPGHSGGSPPMFQRLSGGLSSGFLGRPRVPRSLCHSLSSW